MKKYKIEIIEILSKVVEVEAENYLLAEKIIDEKYGNQEIVLEKKDHKLTSFSPNSNSKKSKKYRKSKNGLLYKRTNRKSKVY